jgi:predicted RND superfamily exporter protein
MLNYFDDTDANVTTVRSLIKNIPGAHVVSRRALGQAFAESAISETHVLVSIAVAFIVVSLLVLTRSLTKSAIIMLPVLCGIVAMLAVMVLMSQAISAISIVAAILVLALGSDYGIFAVFAWDNKETTFGQGMAAVHLSSITTVIGTGALLFAHHPAMFLCGVTLTSGLLGGYLTAFFIVPGVCYLLDKPKQVTQ